MALRIQGSFVRLFQAQPLYYFIYIEANLRFVLDCARLLLYLQLGALLAGHFLGVVRRRGAEGGFLGRVSPASSCSFVEGLVLPDYVFFFLRHYFVSTEAALLLFGAQVVRVLPSLGSLSAVVPLIYTFRLDNVGF